MLLWPKKHHRSLMNHMSVDSPNVTHFSFYAQSESHSLIFRRLFSSATLFAECWINEGACSWRLAEVTFNEKSRFHNKYIHSVVLLLLLLYSTWQRERKMRRYYVGNLCCVEPRMWTVFLISSWLLAIAIKAARPLFMCVTFMLITNFTPRLFSSLLFELVR